MATAQRFFDPFFSSKHQTPTIVDDGPSKFNGSVQCVSPLLPNKGEVFPVEGQGTVAARATVKNLLNFIINTDSKSDPSLQLSIGREEVLFFAKTQEQSLEQISIPFKYLKTEDACWINSKKPTTYWLSIDTENGILRYGKYYTNKSMTLLEAVLKRKDDTGVYVWEDPKSFDWLERVTTAQVTQDDGTQLDDDDVKIWPLPVMMDLSPFVVPGDEITLTQLENGTYTVPANLPESCQRLYGNVAGKKILLDDDDFPDFSKAIERSCVTENCWAYQTLAKKAQEFGEKPNLECTYLRITLGYNTGDSPGVPYVLEIWPSGHYSPIHDHGNACAVIKVLHGDIHASFYDNLDSPKLINTASLKKGDITWIGPNNYQIHKLHNETKGICCTIQCYRYEDQDDVHYDGFNYTGDDGEVHKFEPNSDKAFGEFRELMRKEWNSREAVNGHT
ncbi:hypothetical protein K431DRAFT_245419 [Polychaeton citri CBS 116435]|uniref:Cysteine dioxygenase n=1 Tax=Polychaeton citri CBS 116435 TaxID=1314669 RepID=A0A9P4QC51_9PEZI|nr:hypothetical protein K431DRAFT_245419 [Polychaeton citri CBS 116435]